MGSQNSTLQKTKTINEKIRQTSQKFISELVNQTSQNVNTSNTMTITADDLYCGGMFKATSSAKIAATIVSKMSNKQMLQLSSLIQDTIKKEIKRDIDQGNKGFRAAIWSGNSSKTSDQIINKTKTIVEREVKNTIKNYTSQNVSASNTATFTFKKIYIEGDCIFDQNTTVELVSSNIAENITDAIINDKDIAEISEKSDTKTVQKNEGMLANITGMITNLLSSPLMIIAVIVGIGICLYAYKKLSSSNQQQYEMGYGRKRQTKRSLKYKK